VVGALAAREEVVVYSLEGAAQVVDMHS